MFKIYRNNSTNCVRSTNHHLNKHKQYSFQVLIEKQSNNDDSQFNQETVKHETYYIWLLTIVYWFISKFHKTLRRHIWMSSDPSLAFNPSQYTLFSKEHKVAPCKLFPHSHRKKWGAKLTHLQACTPNLRSLQCDASVVAFQPIRGMFVKSGICDRIFYWECWPRSVDKSH